MDKNENNFDDECNNVLFTYQSKESDADSPFDRSNTDNFSSKSTINTDLKYSMSSCNSEFADNQENWLRSYDSKGEKRDSYEPTEPTDELKIDNSNCSPITNEFSLMGDFEYNDSLKQHDFKELVDTIEEEKEVDVDDSNNIACHSYDDSYLYDSIVPLHTNEHEPIQPSGDLNVDYSNCTYITDEYSLENDFPNSEAVCQHEPIEPSGDLNVDYSNCTYIAEEYSPVHDFSNDETLCQHEPIEPSAEFTMDYSKCASTDSEYSPVNYSTNDETLKQSSNRDMETHVNVKVSPNDCERKDVIVDVAKQIAPAKEVPLTNQTEKTKIMKRFGNQSSSGTACAICSKTVYPVEKLSYDSKCYHKHCFKCSKCGMTIKPTVASTINSNVFCKPHYIELFRVRGRYDDIIIQGADKHEKAKYENPSLVKEDSSAGETFYNSYKANCSNLSGREDDNNSGDFNSEERKQRGESEPSNRVANATKAWSDGRMFNTSDWKRRNSNSNTNYQADEVQSVKSSVRVKNLAALFECNKR